MSQSYQEYHIGDYIKNVRNQMSKLSPFEEESDTPLNQYLQEKYEKSKFSPYNTGGSEAFENSYSATDMKYEPNHLTSKFNNNPSQYNKITEKSDTNEQYMKIHSLESRINELLRIQDSLMKTLEENKIS